VEQVEGWLLAKHVTLWSDWDVTRPQRRRLAAEWFLRENASLMAWLEAQDE
jgi:hypothetical protein